MQIQHSIPGRIRVYVSLLKDNKEKAEELFQQLNKISALKKVNIDTRSGSIVIRFDEREIGEGLLFATIIRLTGLDSEVERDKVPIINREMKDIGDSLNKAVYEKTSGLLDLWTLIFIAFTFFGIKNLFSGRIPVFPAATTFLWWALNGLMRGRIEE